MKELVNITINYPINTPNRNGVVFTCDAVQKAFADIQNEQLPIVDYTKVGQGRVVGIARPVSCIWNNDNCIVSHDCFMFEDRETQKFDVEGFVNKMHKNKDGIRTIDDFRITGVSITEADNEH